MANLANLVGFTTNTTGTSTTLAVVAALQGLRTPAGAGLADGVYSYGIKTGASGSEQYEVGTITIGSSGASITGRTLVNSTTGSLLNLSGTSEVYITDLAADHPTSADGLPEGVTNLYFTEGRVRSTLLSSAVETPLSDSAIVAGDSLLTGIRKLIARILAYSTIVRTWTAAQRGTIATLTDGATVTPDFNAQHFTWTIAGTSRTLANPTNVVAGQSGSIRIVQDTNGNRTITGWGSSWKYAGGSGSIPALSTAANATDTLHYFVWSSTFIEFTIRKGLA